MEKGMKELKFIYETTLLKQVDEIVTEAKEEAGQKIEIKRTVRKTKPVKLAIQKPDRKLFKGAEMFYAKTLSEYLKAGLLPYSLVAKRYANDGGPLTEREKNRLKELREESTKLEAEFYAVAGDDNTKQEKKNEILIKLNSINAEISNIQNAYSDIFDSTAEMKSRNETIEWWVLHLSYLDEDDKGYKPLFGEVIYDERISKLEDYEDKADPFYIEAIKRLSYLISFWFTARDAVTKIDFATMEKLYTDTMSDYKVEKTGEDTKIEEVPTPTPPTVTTPTPVNPTS
jgi:hypothetical protein